MNERKLLFLFAILLLAPFVNARAQDTFSSDRPGLGNGTYVLKPRVAYLETGLEYAEGGTIDQFSFGQILFRQGVIPGAELRLQVNSLVIETRQGQDNRTGVPDPGVGLKFDLLKQPDSRLQLSGLGSVSVPAGYSPFTDDKWHPSATLLADYQLSRIWDWSLGSNLGYTFGPGGTSDSMIFTLTNGFSPPGSSISGYFGYAGFLWESANEHFLEAGATKLIGPNIQIDINGGLDVNNGDGFIGTGLALRF